MKTAIDEKILNKITSIIITNYNPEKIILFGSYARGDADENSDYDIMIIKETNLPKPRRAIQIRKHLRGLKTPIDIVVYTQDEIDKYKDVKTSFVYDVISKGKILYES